ncbi:MAG TPA: YopJ family acetyltransferase [Herbaspirillum sp.]|nr:YopJ family acetyltransferase [Herbaspirillum sp.]
MDQLPDDTAHAWQLLEEQLALTQRYIDAGTPADRTVLEGDIQTMPAFIALENKLHPELNLFIAPTPSALLKKIQALPPAFHLRCVLRSAVDAEHGWHHFYADIQRQADGSLSFLIIEPADLKHNINGIAILLQLFILMLPDKSLTQRRITCFSTAVQKSGSDCLLFCIDFALKAYRHAAQFAALHAIHHSGRAIGNDAGDPVIEHNNQNTLIVAPSTLLPFSFFEHAQSTTALQTIWGDDPRAAELIKEIRAQRATQKYCPSSIEQRRREFLLQALGALAES